MPPQPAAATPPKKVSWRVKPSRLIMLAVGLIVVAGLFFGTRYVQMVRGRQKLMAMAKTLSETKGKEGEALAYLREYLATNPKDLEALSLWSDILFRSSQGSPERLENVVKADEAILRLEPDRDGERRRPRGSGWSRRTCCAGRSCPRRTASTRWPRSWWKTTRSA